MTDTIDAGARTFNFPLTLGAEGLPHENIHVNMDEDFNWADLLRLTTESEEDGGGVTMEEGELINLLDPVSVWF